MNNTEYKFPDEEQEVSETAGQQNMESKVLDADIDVEVVNDTPADDRDREPLTANIVEDLENDDLMSYSDRVRQRLSQLKKVWHDERRAKESADREREEAIRYASVMIDENRRLKGTLSNGEVNYIAVARQAAEQELAIAKRDYREAYDSGDTDRVIESHQRLNEAQNKVSSVGSYRQQYKFETTLQDQNSGVNSAPIQPQVTQPDEKALAWQGNNEWFGSDGEMTGLALGLHDKLVNEGITPSSNEYYRRIDATMRKRYPDYFRGDTQDAATPAQRSKATTVVAPATRSTAPRKVRLTVSQLGFAKRLNLTPEQYAREIVKLEKANG